MTRPTRPADPYIIERDLTAEALQPLREVDGIAELIVRRVEPITVRHAELLERLPPIDRLMLWSGVTRPALRRLIRLPGLRELDVLILRTPGKLAHFDEARTLEAFRCNIAMTASDLRQVARCSTLQKLGIQGAGLTLDTLHALLALPALRVLDAENTPFDDRMAKALGRSTTLTSVELGGTRITRVGLGHILRIPHLTALDLWATPLNEDDLELLIERPDLEYLSLGNHEGLRQLDSERVVSLLLRLPGLKRVWLDGIVLSAEQKQRLRAKLESLRND